MKKYRLITCDTESVGCDKIVKGEYSDSLEAMMQAVRITKDSTNLYYRIEEVEESIMDRVKSHEDACKIIGEESFTKVSLCEYKYNEWTFVDELPDHIIALLKLETITAALNEGWKPDWEDVEQKNWYVVMNWMKDDTCVTFCTQAGSTPSRLYFKSRELAEYAAKQFAELYKQLLVEKF